MNIDGLINNIIWAVIIGSVGIALFSIIHNYYAEDKITVKKLNDTQINRIERYIMRLTPREFEIFVAKLIEYKYKCKFEITPATNDKGKDIILYGYNGYNLTYVECKQYKQDILVGREIVNKLIGSASMGGATNSIIVTTSNYTRTAVDCIGQSKSVKLELWYMSDLIDIIKEMNESDLMNWFGIVIDEEKIIKTSYK